MRGIRHRWMEPARPGAVAEAACAPGLEPLTARILAARGLTDAAAAARFCEPRLTDLHDPSLLPGVDEAAERILDALRGGLRVVVYGDYDVDGVCGAAILHHTLRAALPGLEPGALSAYIPHRLEEGYGLNTEALRRLRDEGADLVVSVDCGITALEQAAAARAMGLRLIITDHHEPAHAPSGDPRDALPDAEVVVHPRRPGAEGQYPFADLCGAAVAFKVAWRAATLEARSERVGEPMRRVLLDMLALASLGTVADVVPLVGENRVIARHGLARLRGTGIEGLAALLEATRLAGEDIDAEHVGFRLGPWLNAAGRMGHAREALELLTTARGDRAREIAQGLALQNTRRQAVERAITEQALAMAEEAGMCRDDRRAVALAHESWHPGVLGIVCSRLVEKRRRPTILMQRLNGECHGSGRSIDGVDLHAALSACSGRLEKFGGHAMAAGLRLKAENLEAFTEEFIEHVNARTTPADLAPTLRYDCDATMADLTPRAVAQTAALGPFGRGNPRPAVRLRGIRLAADADPLGSNGKHLALHVKQGDRMARMVAWNWGEERERLKAGMMLDAVVEPKVSTWNGRTRVEPEVRDLAPASFS